MQAHIPEERRILLEQIRVQIQPFWSKMILQRQPIGPWEISVAGHSQAPSNPPQKGWKPYQLGTHWGQDQPDFTVWFRSRFQVPKSFRTAGSFVQLQLDPAREALVYFNGYPYQGLTDNHKQIRLIEEKHLKGPIELVIEAYTESPRCPSPIYHGRFTTAEIQQIDQVLHQFVWDLSTAYEVLRVIDQQSSTFMKMLEVLARTLAMVYPLPSNHDQFQKKVRQATQYLDKAMAEFQSVPSDGALLLAGHSHIDTAWLWTLVETQRKCGRTFSTMLTLMDHYPEFCFSQSQPALYQFTKQHYPKVYERIKKRIKDGRWDVAGAPWVEMDSQISGGEALVRQMVYGNLFYESEFGKRSNICWLPDAFGFNWNLPQILSKAGIDVFLTTKIEWSEVTRFPYTVFDWEGVDGTKVLGVMPPLAYNGLIRPDDLRTQWNSVKQKNLIDEMLYTFGHGDGGGGTTYEMIEAARRLSNRTGVPKCRFGTITEYCRDLLNKVDRDRLPVWNSELYLELHRACQTTQSRTKRNNRKMECLLHDTEWISSIGYVMGFKYPSDTLIDIWRMVLTNQFHDILPGSSIKEVYEEAEINYATIRAQSEKLRQESAQSIATKIDTVGPGKPILVINTLGWNRQDPVCLETKLPSKFHVLDLEGCEVPFQVTSKTETSGRLWFTPRSLPSMGYAVYRLVEGENPVEKNSMKASERSLENQFYRIHLDTKGQLSRVYDKKAKRDVLAPGQKGNVLQMFHDQPHTWDAWDVDFNFEENSWVWDDVVSIKVVEQGPVRAAIEIQRNNGRSSLVQRVVLYANSPRIDFETEVDWFEKLVMMKALFPVNIRSSHATYEIQFATIERATHRNTPYDRARFEVPHQKWADLSEGNYGVAIANDCKYGFDVHDNLMRLTLLRGAVAPDATADEGHHTFTYSLIPHQGDWRVGQVVQRAIELNIPPNAQMVSSARGKLPSTASFLSCSADHVVMDTLKKAEKEKCLVLRLYESQGSRGLVEITTSLPLVRVSECNLMEEQDAPVKVGKNNFRFDIKPYEIRSFKLYLSNKDTW